MGKKVKVLYYGRIADIPEEGVEAEGELTFLPFSSAEPPYCQVEEDKSVTYLDWIAILETLEDEEKT